MPLALVRIVWNGNQDAKLDPVTGKPSTSDTTLYSLASRNGGAIEAPSIISHNVFYYLFFPSTPAASA